MAPTQNSTVDRLERTTKHSQHAILLIAIYRIGLEPVSPCKGCTAAWLRLDAVQLAPVLTYMDDNLLEEKPATGGVGKRTHLKRRPSTRRQTSAKSSAGARASSRSLDSFSARCSSPSRLADMRPSAGNALGWSTNLQTSDSFLDRAKLR